MHQLHGVSLPLLAFGWVSLAAAHGWNRLRHRGGGLPWAMNVLWLSTWVMVGSTAVIGLEEVLLGHEDEAIGVNWPHVVQQGLAWTYVALLGATVAVAAGWWRFDPTEAAARVVPGRGRQAARALVQLLGLALGVGLAGAAAVVVFNTG